MRHSPLAASWLKVIAVLPPAAPIPIVWNDYPLQRAVQSHEDTSICGALLS
jgi:hypothetical protein